jgi:hypothetical protein
MLRRFTGAGTPTLPRYQWYGWAIADNFLDIAARWYVLLNSAVTGGATMRQLAKQTAWKARRGCGRRRGDRITTPFAQAPEWEIGTSATLQDREGTSAFGGRAVLQRTSCNEVWPICGISKIEIRSAPISCRTWGDNFRPQLAARVVAFCHSQRAAEEPVVPENPIRLGFAHWGRISASSCAMLAFLQLLGMFVADLFRPR